MEVRKILVCVVLFSLGLSGGVVASAIFFQNVITGSLNARLLGDLSQDVAMFSTLEASNVDMSNTLAKNRLVSTLTGIKAQWPYLSDKDRNLATRVMQKIKGKDQSVDEVLAKE